MKQNIKNVVRAFSIELPLYGILVVAYVFLVLHFLGGWLYQLYGTDRKIYALTALGLIIGQGFILEMLSRALLGAITGRKEK